MAGGGAPTPSAGGKKAVDFQLNMIPFIDLLSVLISFLLMTSVWTQIAKIDVQQSPNQPGEPTEEQPKEKLELSVLIKSGGYAVSLRGAVEEIPLRGEDYDSAKLGDVLGKIMAEHSDLKDVTITSEDKVPYKALITVMDTCLLHQLTGISVAGVDA